MTINRLSHRITAYKLIGLNCQHCLILLGKQVIKGKKKLRKEIINLFRNQTGKLKILISSNRKGRLVSTGGPVFFDNAKVHTINHYRKFF